MHTQKEQMAAQLSLSPYGPISSDASPLGNEATTADLSLRADLIGGPPEPPQAAVPVRLDSNESPYPPSRAQVDDIAESIREAVGQVHRYPDRHMIALRRDLAEYIYHRTRVAIDAANVWPANGSLEIFQQLLQLFGGMQRTALGFAPYLPMYRTISAVTDTQWVEANPSTGFAIEPCHAVAAIRYHQPDVVFVGSPNNPTGQSVSLAALAQILDAAPGIVIVDETYAEYSAKPSAVGLIGSYPSKLVVVRSMSKALALAGARLGYLVASPAIVNALSLVRLPYHLSAITQAAARAALRHADDTLAAITLICEQRERVSSVLRQLGFDVISSEANFVFFGPFADAARAWQRYLGNGVLVRNVGVPGYLRATIGLLAENETFLAVSKSLAADELRHAA